jgi:UDP-glucose 4-epimerase
MKNYLVTGAAGFIGSHIAQKFLQNGHQVWTIDNLRTGDPEKIPAGVHFIKGSCQDDAVIAQLKNTRFDAIVHIAGQSSGQISFEDPLYDFQTNVEATLKLVEYALRTRSHRFIYASSMSVYGHVPDEPIAESRPAKPISFYGIGKLTSEQYLQMYAARGLQPTSVRFFNVYGPNQNMNNLKQGMISIYLAQLLKNDKVVVKGALDRFRDFIYIDDAADFVARILDDPKALNGIFNCGTGVKTTVDDLLKKLARISGIQKDIVQEGSTPGDQKGIYADMALAHKTFGFKPKTNLDTGLQAMVEWAKTTTWSLT